MKKIRMTASKAKLPLQFSYEGSWYVFPSIGSEVDVPAGLADMLLAAHNPFGTFTEVMP